MAPRNAMKLFVLLMTFAPIFAAPPDRPYSLPPPNAPIDGPAATLSFNKETGKFKILQYADMHFENGANTVCNSLTDEQKKWPCTDLNTTDFLRRLIELEKPDLVVFTGDNIDGGAHNATVAMHNWAAVVGQFPGLQWAAVEGNHDAQSTLSREDVFKVLSSLPGSISQPGPSTLHGYGNYYVKITNTSGQSVHNLFLLDTGSGSEYPQISGYDWAWPDQVSWYLRTSEQLKIDNDNQTVPAVAFFHICTPEYWDALDAKAPISGDNFERGGCSGANSGLFTAFLEQDDVKMVNVGHDHVNDYCVNWKGVDLCYGGGCGFGAGAYGKTGWARRARVIELGQDPVTKEGTIDTWKRLDYYMAGLAMKDQEQIWPEPPAPDSKTCETCVNANHVWCYHDSTCYAHGDKNDTKTSACPGQAKCASDKSCDCNNCDDKQCQPSFDSEHGLWREWQLRSNDYTPSDWRPQPEDKSGYVLGWSECPGAGSHRCAPTDKPLIDGDLD